MTTEARLAVVAAAALAGAIASACAQPEPPAPPPPPEVYVTNVIARDVPEYLDLVGQTVGSQDVEIRARVEGFLDSVNFQEGTFVKRGQLLYQIDRKPLEALLAAARADQATAEARLAKATNDVNRYTPLVAKQAVSRQELDNAMSERDAAGSQVEAAKAAVEKATIDLSYTRINAPLTGLAGTTLVRAGNLVGRGESTLLTTISQIDPIFFRVGVTEADYLRVVRRQPQAPNAANARAGIILTLTDGSVYPESGRIDVVDRAVDPTTGTLALQLAFPNSKQILRPGQYGRARILLDTRVGALLVPQRAVQELQNLYSVAVVDGGGKVAFRNVTVGPRVDSLWVIEKGVAAGDQVVVEGLQRIQDGMTVTAKPAPPAEGGKPAAAAAEAR